MSAARMKAGQRVTLRPPAEILATLDANGATDGLPFMPEMLEYFGRTFQVQTRVERACDVLKWGVRQIPDTVMLDDLRCSGSAHAGCQAACRLYWKEAWLRPASESAPPDSVESDAAYAELSALVGQNAEAQDSTADEPIFRCQATDWIGASRPVGWWNVRSFVGEWTCGNVSFWRFAVTMTRIVFSELGRRLHLIPRGLFMKPADVPQPVDAPRPGGLAPGTLVQIRSKREIAPTLDAKGKNRGLWFDREMLPYCGKTFPIKTKVERFVDEETGKLIRLKSDCYILDGVVCSGNLNEGKWFCQKAIYSWWREAWLRPVGEDSVPTADSPGAPDRTPPPPPA